MSEPDNLLDKGMREQLAAYRAAIAGGMPRLGWKVGLNDPAAYQRLGLDGPIAGWLNGRRLIREGEPYVPPAGAKPRIEAETAILVGADVAAGTTAAEARAAISAVAPAIEFVDATKPLSPLDDLLANDILHEAVMIGSSQPLARAGGLVAAGFPAVTKNGEPAGPPMPGRYRDDLGEIVASVAVTLGRYGEQLCAGDWIIGGSYINPFDVAPGDQVTADFGPLGTLAFRVS